MRHERSVKVVLLSCCVLVAACSTASSDFDDLDIPGSQQVDATVASITTAADDHADGDVRVEIDGSAPGEPISPLILGISGDYDAAQMTDVGIHLDSWGGNPSTRFNYVSGHYWNAARDWEYRNTNYGNSGDAFRSFVDENMAAGVTTRVAVPTLGWIAGDDDQTNCSFPDGEGGCVGDGGADCRKPGPIADPTKNSTRSTPEMVASWVQGMVADGLDVRFVAMDNEPELWGATHYDVHPACTTYEEILDTYLEYATAIRAVAPQVELTGPVICCWFDYWRVAPGPADGSGADFLEWFLVKVREHDEASAGRAIDVVDVHFYPQTGVFNGDTDDETNARRLRSTRALWDPTYVDESWIRSEISFIPRLQRVIERSYPGLPLMISEWNFGADDSMNGALAISDVLGIYGREGVYAAAYWRSPPPESPGYMAFKMHGNYDGAGSRFGGRVLGTSSSDVGRLSAFAAADETTGMHRVMLVNKEPDEAMLVDLEIDGIPVRSTARRWTYGAGDLAAIRADTADIDGQLDVPASSIVVLELAPG